MANEANESTKWLYEQLKGKGYNVGKDVNEFDSLMRSNADSRQWAYDTAKKSGLNVGKDIDEFSSLVGGSTSPAPVIDTTPDQTAEVQPSTEKKQEGWKPTPLQKALKMEDIYSGVDSTLGRIRQSEDNTRRLMESLTDKGRDRRKSAEMRAKLAGTPTKVLGLTPNASPATDGATGTTPKSNANPNSPMVHGVKYEDGVAKTEWMLPDGSLSTSFIDADKAEYGARQARLQYEFIKRMEQNGLDPAKKDDVEKQRQKDLLDTAEKQTEIRLAENEENLHELYDKRAKRIDEQGEWRDDESFWSNFVRIVGGAANRSVTANAPKTQTARTPEDSAIGTYLTENQVLTDAKKQLETRKLSKSDGFMGGFWKLGNNWRNMKMGARHTLTDADLYAGGVMALQKATRLMDIEDKLKQGVDLTDAEVSLVYSTMLGQNIHENIETPHGYNAAKITVEMFPFMAQMALNPASGLSRAMVTKYGKSGLRKIAIRKATQGLTGDAAEAFAKKETRKLAAKTVGVQVLGDIAEGAVLANTLQAPKTAANAIERYQGDVVEDDKGDLSFDGNHNWGEAIYKAEASAIIENYTEMLGEHFGIIGNAIGKGAGKGLRAVGGGKVVDSVSDMIGKIGSTEWAKAIGEVEKRAHWNGTVGEVLEEEAGIVLNSIFTGDNKINDLWDADQQIDIVLGVGLFGGFMSGIKSVGYPIGKFRAKGNLRKRDSIGSWRFGDEWEGIRTDIENTDEKDLGTVIRDLVRSHAKSDEQGKAIIEYAHALMNARGYEIASASVRSDGNITPEQQDIEDSFEHGELLVDGENPQEMNDAKRELERARQKFVNSSSEDFVKDHFDGADAVNNLSNLGTDPELRQEAVDYVNAKAVYDGMIQRVRDDVDGRIAQSDAMIDSRVNQETGMIQPATMKIDDRKVYIVKGTVSMFEDGTGVDAQNSSESVIIRDAETGKVEFADPTQFLSIDEAIDVESEKEAARKQIIDEIAVTAANNIDGVLSFTPGDSYSILDAEGNQQPVTILGNSVDEEGLPVDWSVDIQYPDGTIQSVVTSELQQLVDAASTQRVEQFDQERSMQRDAEAEAALQADQSGLSNPNRRTDLMPDDYKMPYDNRPVRASRYIESENGTGGTLYQDENGNDAIVIAAIDDNNYVGYFREYDEQGNPTNRWSAKFQNGSGLRENHRDMMLTAQELLPAGHELTEHTSVSTDGLRNLANQLKHGYELQYDEQGNVITDRVAVNMMARENDLGLLNYNPGSTELASASYRDEAHRADINARLAQYLAPLGLGEEAITWEDGTLYVDHPILRRADTPQQEVQPTVPENAETVLNSAENTEIPTENRDLGTDPVPKTEIPVKNVQQTADDGFIPIDPEIKPDENGVINIPSPGTAEADAMLAPEESKPTALSQIPTDEKGDPIYEQADAGTAWDALLEETEDEQIAQNVIAQEIAEREDALKKLEKQKPKAGLSTREKIQAEKDKKKALDAMQRSIDHWKAMGETTHRRQQAAKTEQQRIEAERLAEQQRAEAERIAEEQRIEAERKEREKAEREEVAALKKIDRSYADIHAEVKEYPEAVERLRQQLPEDILEAAAVVLSTNKLLWGNHAGSKGTAAETGFKEGERKGLFSMFASKEKGGKSIARLAEDEMKQICDVHGIPYDNSAARDALIEIISQSRIPSDITRFIRRRRIEQARQIAEGEQRREREAFGEWAWENYHMSADDFESYQENLDNENTIDHENFDFNDFNGNIADELINYNFNQNETLHERGDQGYEPHGESIGLGGSNQVLSSQQSIASQRSQEDAGRPQISQGNGDNLLLPDATLVQDSSRTDSAITQSQRPETKDQRQSDLDRGAHEVSTPPLSSKIAKAEVQVNTDPTDKQKEAGNYKKGHVQVGAFDVTIENPKGSKRSGMDANGKRWETTMTHTYGYILGTTGVDGDHIDVFISSDVDAWDGRKAFVVDQYNPDGSFDEHKVMLGFNDRDEAFDAYLSNYEKGWENGRRLDVTAVNLEDFEKWIDSSKRKTKAFADYKGVKSKEDNGMVGRSLTEREATDLIARMEANAKVAPATELSPENWITQFGEDGIVDTPLGVVKMGANQLLKLYSLKRTEYFGMIHPTLNSPDVIIEKNAPTAGAERDSKYLFVKTFIKSDGSRLVHFESVTVKRDGMEVSISSHEAEGKAIKKEMQNGKILHLSERLSPGSERYLTEAPSASEGPDLVPTSDNNIVETSEPTDKRTGTDDNPMDKRGDTALPQDSDVSDGKDNTLPSDKQTDSAESSDGYTIEPRNDTRDNSDIFAVKFEERVSREVFKGQKAIAKKHGGYWSNFGKKGFLFKTREDAEAFANEVMGKDETQLSEDAPLSIDDMQSAIQTEVDMEYALDYKTVTNADDFMRAIRHDWGETIMVHPASHDTMLQYLKRWIINGRNRSEKQLGNALQKRAEVDLYSSEEKMLKTAGFSRTQTALTLIDNIDKCVYDIVWRPNQTKGGRNYVLITQTSFSPSMPKETTTEKTEISSLSEEIPAEKKVVNPSGNKLVTDEQYAELLAKMRKKMGGQLNMGVDPEILAIGSMMAVYHIEKGARKFAEYVKAMVADLGEKFPARYLKGFYKAAHEMIEDAAPEIAVEMDSDDVVNTADVASIISGRIDAMATAEMVVEEETAEKEREEAERKLKDERNVRLNPDGSTSETVTEGGVEIEVTKGDFIPGVRRNNGKAEWTGQTEEPKKKKSQKKTVSSQSEQPGLFGGLFDEEVTPTDNDIRRNDAVSTERLPSDNRGQSEGNRENQGAQSQGTRQGSERTDRAGEESGAERTRTVRPRLSRLNENERRNTKNNRAERGTDYAPKSEDARIRANIAAIELARRLIESGEQATSEDMQWLRMFSGWGGLGKAFTNNAYADRIRKLLGDSYQDAVDSRKSAYYTPAAIIDSLWDIAKAMGFQGGTILEGSAGIGNILGLMPEEISERSEIRAVEVDSTTGSILSLLYPDAQVDIQGFEETKIENGSIDLAITNVPFITGWNVIDKTGDKDLSKKFKDIHDFCIAKNIRKLREGGIGIFITSSGTLDNSAKLRAWVTNEGNSDVVGAFRLHNETFGGTGATSDIIVVRKRVNGKKSAHAIDVSEVSGVRTAEYDTGETKKVKVDGHKQEVPVVDVVTMDYNRYFVEHPEHMAGEMHFGFEKGDTYRAKSKALYPVKGMNQEAMLSAWAQSFSDMDFDAAPSNKNEYETTYDTVGNEVKVGSMVIDDRGRLCVNTGGLARPLMSARKNKQDTRTDDELISMFNSKKIKGRTRQQCLKDYNGIKKALADVLEYQTTHEDNEGLEPLLSRLNATFDSFVSRYGNLHKNNQLAWLRNDVDYPGILALERYEERGDESGNRIKKFGKTDIFSRRVVEKETIPQPKNVKDGIITSLYISGRVDVGYISEQLGISDKQVREEIVSSGLGFENPVSREMEVSYEYLSGNVREKLRQATANNTDGKYDANIKALEKVVPMNIPAHLIEFALGSSWIEPKLYEDYVKERTGVDVNLTNVGGTWFMKTSGSESNTEQNRSQGVYSEELKKTVFGHEILEAAITNRSIAVSRTYKRSDGTYETVTDRDATQAVAAKVDEFRIDFKDWARAKMQGDMEMSSRMETVYNDRFNNSVPRSIPDEFIPKHFGGQVTEMGGRPFSLRPHQAKAVIRGTTQSQLLAHEVGTGKTFTLISTAMEMRRLGTARKPMIVVQNSTVGQFVESAKVLYPNAKVLTLEDADRNAQGRKDFYAKIRYNDWDMIVIPQSVLDMIPDSEERQIRFIQDKIAEKMLVLQQMAEQDPDGSSWITKQAEKEISDLENDLAKITESLESKRKEKSEKDMKKEAQTRHNAEVRAMEMLDRTTDDVENFDQMGIDALLVDEAHEYKHLGFATAMQRGVKGVDPSYSKKAQGLYLKTQAVMERNRGRNVIFATGTPISNTAAEIWTFMRYLMPEDEMHDYGIYYFDDFVRNFGNLQQMLEFATNGKFKENNRFAGYVNLPELVRIWSTVTDTVLTREAGGVSDKIPDMEGGKAQDIYLPQTKALRSVMLYVKSELDRYDKMTGKEKKANSHIPLTMYGIAKAAAVDARLVYSDAADEPQSKTNEAVRQTLRSLEETSDYKGTVAIFADNYQNKQSGFNLYEDIRRKLIEQGVPAEQIVVMKSGMTVKKKLEIFDKVNAGEVRVILGSTYTLGTGVNIQERLHTLIHLDAPNRPMDYTQRNGRILRQGNLHKDMGLPVRVLRFGVEDSLDVTAYQRLKTKGAIADSIMNGSKMMENSMETRSLEEDEDVFGDITAQLSGSEYAMLKNQAEKEVRKLNSKLKQWEADQTYIHNQIPRLKGQIRESEKRQKTAQENLDVVRRIFPNGTFKTITIGKQTFSDLESMNKLFTEHNKSVMDISDQIRDNKISGPQTRKLTIDIDGLKFEVTTVIDKEMGNNGGNLFSKASRKVTYSCPELPGVEDVPVSGARLKGAVEDIVSNLITGKDYAEMVDVTQSSIDRNQTELKQIEQRKDKEFEYYDELAEAKERLEEYTEKMKAELAEKEAKYADMDADVEVASDITLSEEDSEETEDEELLRDGYGAYSDADVSIENDPWSKAWGESIRTKRQQKQFAERERERMRERAKSLSSILGLDIEVIEDSSTLKGKKQRAKGWYDTKTGKIAVVVSNHNSASDMEATILHEAVAHHGLRQLLGKHFDEFLDKVYEAAENGIKEQIDLLASRNGWNRRVATEEYLAGLAERTDFDRAEERVGGWFDKIKRLFFDMLFKAGFKHIKPGSIGDNELRYILWRSYQNMANPGRYRAFEWEAEDVAMQYKLQVGEYDATSNNAITAADSDIRFRDGDFTPRDRALAALQYEHMLSRGSWQFREATQDSMLGLKTLYESILGSNLRIENVAGYENAYLYENRMSSANNGEQHQYFSRFMKPLLESIHKLCGSKELDRRILTDYMMAKHGLERNEYMRNEAAANGEDTKRDFAGLCGLTGEDDWQVAETVAQQMVDDYEADHNTAELWDNVQKATNATLEKIYLSGLISDDTYIKVLGMYDFYIPLRGWDETTSDEVYGYLTSKDGPLMGSVFKTAEGRDSKADDPIATIAMMADDAIRQGNRNIMKQRFLNFVHGNPSDLVSVNEMWLQHNDVTDEWEPVFADLQPNMTHAEVESEIAKFEAKMEALRTAEPDKYKKGGDARNIPYKVVRGNLNEHQVLVKRNGRTYVMTINGNPRAAQALNGLTNPNVEVGGVIGDLLKLGEYVNRHLSAFYTTRNPDFVVSNFMRDMLYSNCMTWVKENPRYALRFHKNFGKVNPLTLRRLLSKWENDNLSDSNYLEKMFKEFMLNGGETGYTSVKDIEGHKRTIASELKKQGSTGRKAWNALGMQLDLLNRSAENCARFAAFLTSREMGRTLDRSIHDAKEVSVNFNKKGSGGKFVHANGQKLLGKIGSYLGGGGRIAFVFWNAGIQGMTNFGRAGKRNPGKAIGGAAALFTLGYVIPLLAQMLGGGDGDDDDKNAYYNLPEYVRRSNICFKAGEQWITIPLPIEYRAIYGMGELACGVISGNERYSNSELAYYMAAQISQTLPLDFLEGANPTSHDGFNIKSISHPFIPSAFKPFTEAYIMNKGWTGLPVYKDTPYNKNEPEWTKAYQSTDQHLVAFTRWLNETSGGNDYKKGTIDINPAKLEYLLNGTFGGMVSFPMKIKKGWFETPFGDRDFEWRTQPFFNRVVKSGDERTANRKLQNEYFKYLNEYEETNRLRKKYENAADDGILGYAERADFLYNSPEYLRFEIFEEYKPDIDAIREEIKGETDPEAKKELQNELFATMRELVDKLHNVDK